VTRQLTLSVVAVLLVTALVAGLGLGTSRRMGAGARPVSLSPSPRAIPERLVTIEVGGMTCAGCVDKIRRELSSVRGVKRVEVSLARRRAEVLCDVSLADTALIAAVRRAGPEYLGLILDP
jgi:copper chaperone CopZ